MGRSVSDPESIPLSQETNRKYVELDRTPTKKTKARTVVRLIYSIVVANVAPFVIAFAFVFSSPLLDEIISNAEKNPWLEGLDNCSYHSLIAPIFLLGSIVGGLLSLWLLKEGGPRSTFLGALFIFSAGWATIGGSRFVSAPVLFRLCLLGGRFISGVGEGLLHASWTMYAGEIAPDKYRAAVMALGYLNYTLGIIAAYILGDYFSYWVCAFAYCAICAVYIPFAAMLQKSPLRTEEKTRVCSSLAKLPAVLRKCFTKQDNWESSKNTVRSFVNRLVMMEIIVFFYVFMGYSAIVQYVGPILNVAGAQEWNVPHGVLIAASIGGGDLVGSLLSVVVAVKLGRIQSLFIGAVGICVGHAGLAIYFLLVGELNVSTTDLVTGLNATNQSQASGLVCFFQPTIQSDVGLQYSPIALISLAIVMIMYGTFWMMQPFVITVELFPDNWRGSAAAIFTTSSYTQYFAVAFIFQLIETSIGLAPSFLILAVVAICAAILIPCLIPETKGKPMGTQGDRFTPKTNCTEFWGPIKRAVIKLSAVCKQP